VKISKGKTIFAAKNEHRSMTAQIEGTHARRRPTKKKTGVKTNIPRKYIAINLNQKILRGQKSKTDAGARNAKKLPRRGSLGGG